MRACPPARLFSRIVFLAVWALQTGCNPQSPDIYVAAQDFRFVPDQIRLAPNQAARLVIRNEGRERHEIGGPLLAQAELLLTGPRTETGAAKLDPSGVPLAPGQSLEVRFTPKPGTYDLRCLIKGHTGMHTLVIVEG